MRIGIDARMYGAESTTGIGVYIHRLTDKIFNIDQKNEYYLFMLEPIFSEFKPPRDKIKKVKADVAWYSWSEQIKFPKLLNKYSLDLVHFPHFNVPILYRRNFVVTIHDITPKFFPGPKVKKSFHRKLAYRQVFNHALKKSRQIITVSHHTKEDILSYYPKLGSKISVVYPGISKDFTIITDKNLLAGLKNKYGIRKSYIFYLGVWRDHKNITGLISAFEIIKKQSLDYQLVLGGVPDIRYPEISQAISNCPYKKDIILPGFIPETELPLFYNAASLFVLPSFCEGFGLVAVEAVACGTPVVASKTTSVPEILGNAALYFDPASTQDIASKISEVLKSNTLAKNLVTSGQDIVKKYNWQDCAQKTLEVYNVAAQIPCA